MTARVAQSLFPQRLEAFDQIMVDDDHPRYPMTYVQVVEFSGRVNEAAFAVAMQQGLARHPLLLATLDLDKKNRRIWKLNSETAPPKIDFDVLGVLLVSPQKSRIKLGREPGVRTYVRSNDERTEVTCLFHHACTDGLGSYHFIGDVLAAYAQATGTPEARTTLTALEPDRIKTRGQTMMFGKERNRPVLTMSAILGGMVKRVITNEAAKLAPPRRANFDEALQPFPGIVTRTYDQQQFRTLRKAAEKLGVFSNDLVLAAAFLVMAQWNRRQGRKSAKPFRIMMPQDMRGKGDEQMPAANVVSLAFLEREAAQCEDAATVLDSIRQETLRIRNEADATEYIQAITLGYAVPGFVNTCLRGNGCLSTVLVSNTGDPTRRFTADLPRNRGKLVCGNLVLEHIYGISPIRRGTRLAIAVQAYNRRLTISMRTDPYRFTLHETRNFMELFHEQLATLTKLAG